jgi:hypothetical protein
MTHQQRAVKSILLRDELQQVAYLTEVVRRAVLTVGCTDSDRAVTLVLIEIQGRLKGIDKALDQW